MQVKKEPIEILEVEIKYIYWPNNWNINVKHKTNL